MFNKESEFHFKNRSKRDRTYWEDKLEDGQLYTVNTGYKSSIVSHLQVIFYNEEDYKSSIVSHLQGRLYNEEDYIVSHL